MNSHKHKIKSSFDINKQNHNISTRESITSTLKSIHLYLATSSISFKISVAQTFFPKCAKRIAISPVPQPSSKTVLIIFFYMFVDKLYVIIIKLLIHQTVIVISKSFIRHYKISSIEITGYYRPQFFNPVIFSFFSIK